MPFFQGLNENIKDELATKEYPQSLKFLENLANGVISTFGRETSIEGPELKEQFKSQETTP